MIPKNKRYKSKTILYITQPFGQCLQICHQGVEPSRGPVGMLLYAGWLHSYSRPKCKHFHNVYKQWVDICFERWCNHFKRKFSNKACCGQYYGVTMLQSIVQPLSPYPALQYWHFMWYKYLQNPCMDYKFVDMLSSFYIKFSEMLSAI